jgi:hypothetical protein
MPRDRICLKGNALLARVCVSKVAAIVTIRAIASRLRYDFCR